MDIIIDYSFLNSLMGLPAYAFVWKIFWSFYGWLLFAIAFLWASAELWLKSRRIRFGGQQKFIFLAIDVHRNNVQTPKAVENIFTYLAGAHGTINFLEKWWDGKYQLAICMEIVSIDGYMQFLVHTPEQFRNLVESAIYSQYPDAEITEVNDYAESAPNKFPDDEWDMWGAEVIQARHPAYPIKTYKDFEEQMGPTEAQYKDTMASLMDLGSSLVKGEQLWFQILLIPIGFDWPEIGNKEINKVIGEKVKSKENILDKFFGFFIGWIKEFNEQISGSPPGLESQSAEKEDSFKMMNLKPREKRQIEGIQDKVSKLGFEFKMRFIYLAKKEVMAQSKVVNGFIGFIKQFAAMDLNNLKPDIDKTATKTAYFFRNYIVNLKKMRLMAGYKKRDDTIGRLPGILNIEELASIWHFPIEAVSKSPLLQKIPTRKAEAPSTLPIGEKIVSEEIVEPIFEAGGEIDNNKDLDFLDGNQNKANNAEEVKKAGESKQEIKIKGAPPSNLPVA